jgi:electron transport complex protein RnfG
MGGGKMRDIIKLGVYLLIIGALAGIGVAYVNNATEPIITESAAEEKIAGLKEVYPDSDKIEDETDKYVNSSTPSEIKEVNVAYQGTKPVGVIYTVEPKGYSGPISTVVGFDIEKQEITRIKILSQSETPGLGDQCQAPWFLERFQGKKAAQPLRVTKQEPAEANEIVAITASTITSEAVTHGVNAAREHFLDHFGQ